MENNSTEIERFASMYRQQVIHTTELVKNLNKEQFEIIPLDSETNFLGTRVNKINISSLLKHLIVAESHWFNLLSTIKENETMPLPLNAEIIKDIDDERKISGRLITVCEEGISKMIRLSNEQLNTKFSFVGSQFTVMGFLWSLYSHHAYHKGQIDQIMRQINIMPIEYLEYSTTNKFIG